MAVCSPFSTSARNAVVHLSGRMGSNICAVVSRGGQFNSCCFSFHSKRGWCVSQTSSFSPSASGFRAFYKHSGNFCSLTVKGLNSKMGLQRRNFGLSLACQRMDMRLVIPNPKRGMPFKIKCNAGPISWLQGCASAGLISGLIICCSSSEPVHAETSDENDAGDSFYVKFSHGKKVYTDYSITGIPGDGRCLFRSVVHGACLRSGKRAPSDSLQRELADDLRTRVADEFIKRREETEWFVEGDFDTYVSQIRKPHVWGGEPELFLASHVLQMPITVYMHDKNAGGLIAIAEYGQEYGDNPIRVLYHGFGHYDALQIPGRKAGKSKL